MCVYPNPHIRPTHEMSAKVLEMGFYTCAHSHLQRVFDLNSPPEASVRRLQQNDNTSGLWRTDVYKQDRQNSNLIHNTAVI